MYINLMSIFAVTMVLFAVIDMIGNVPLVIELRKKYEHVKSGKSTIIAAIVLLVALFGGKYIFAAIGLKIAALGLAGAIILFILGAEMVLNVSIFKEDNTDVASDATIFPLAFPLIAGPGSISTVLSLTSIYDYTSISISIMINMIFVYIVLKSTTWIGNKLGVNGMLIIRKIFGVILIGLSSQMFINNLKLLWFN